MVDSGSSVWVVVLELIIISVCGGCIDLISMFSVLCGEVSCCVVVLCRWCVV